MSVKGFQVDINIEDLADVTISGSPPLAIGDALIYTGAGFTNNPTPILLGLDGLPDVTLTPEGSPGSLEHDEKELVSYDKTIEQWIDRKIPAAGLMAASSGLMTGGELQFGTLTGSPATTTTITVAAGTGVVVDNYTDPQQPTYTNVSWAEFTDVAVTSIAVASRTFVAINSAGTLLQQTAEYTSEQHRDIIHLGTVGHANNVNVIAVRNNPHAAFDVNVRLGDLAEAIGAFNITGNVYSADGALYNIDKSAGESYRLGNNFHTSKKSPDITDDAFADKLSFNYSYRGASDSEFVLLDATTTIDPDNYDGAVGSPSTLEAMPVNQWQVQIIKHFPGGAGTRIEYGQTTYGTAEAAIAEIPDPNHVHNPAFADGIIRGYLVIQEGEVAGLTDAQFIEAGKFGASGAGGAAGGGIFTSAFESSPLSITASTDHAVAHGLGVRPSGMQAFLRCNTAEFGYAIGDEVEFMNDGATNYRGLYANITNIGWYTGVNLVVTNRTTGAEQQVTLASWDIILRAYA